ncbi:glycoside hydrolase family 17 protein [[Candida] arabinofermentans NRRL YB-2248]|uniref:Glycoside hydrolase family 17 protein n=1 Tax=[Candida] arabinofermentans NRRL YB-2248 TaxID=983967 RepID=A0A1E4SYI2_9ASCO|nr:glycoside hydrolase family 17 protein [[Candida] arabinofermentans NRRL YB-2248]
MRYSKILTSLTFASVALSTPFHRHHEHAKRDAAPDVVTVLVTVYATGSEPSSTESESSSSSSETETALIKNAVATASASSSASYQPTTLKTSYLSSASSSASSSSSSSSSESSSASASASKSSSASSSTASAGSVEAYAEQGKGITYSPYEDDGSCKSSSTISSDISMLSAYDVIRVYAPDCSCISAIMGTMGSNQKVFAGLYYMDSLSSDISTLSEQVKASSQGWDGVYAIGVGNEWVNGGSYTVSEVSAAVSSARSILEDDGYTGSVVTVDTLVAYQDNTDLCDVSDFIAVNSHPYWDGGVEASDSGSWLKTQISNIKSSCGGDKDVLICETGWPTQGDTYGTYGIPSKSNQLAAIKSIAEEVGDQVLMFTTYNDLWKDAGDYGVEKYWESLQSLLYNSAIKQTQQLRKDLEIFENNPINSPLSIIGQITTTITTLTRTLQDYEDYILKQTLSLNESQKLKNENRLKNLKDELIEYKLKFQLFKKQREDGLNELNKNQLLYTNRSTAISDNPYDESNGSSIVNRANAKSIDDQNDNESNKYSSLSMQEGLYKEQTVLEKSNQQLDDILEMGKLAFDDLIEQNEVILKMKDKMSSSLQTLGVSKATIRKIEKKAFEDKWIFYIGALITLYIMYLIYSYLG